MYDASLSVSYEYKDNDRDSLKIRSINIKKEHSIDREDHNYIMDEDIKEIYETNSTVRRRCSNPTFLKKFLIYTSIKKNKLNTKGKF